MPTNKSKNIKNAPVVLIAIETLDGGGAERVALELIHHWPADHHAKPVLLVALRRGAYLAELPCDFPLIEVGVLTSLTSTPLFLHKLRALLRGHDIAGVISHQTSMNRILLRACMAGIIRAPVIVVEHNNFVRSKHIAQMPRLRSRLMCCETGFLYRRAHAVVGVSQGLTDQIGRLFIVPPERLRAIPNQLDRRFLEPTKMDPNIAAWFAKLKRPVVVSVGRMVEQKGFDDLIRAFAMLNEGSLVILGEGPLRKDLEALSQELGIADRVVMPGFLINPQQVLQSADLYAASSLWEGYNTALIEAYASGLPVVARDCDFGPSEIVLPDRPGRLVRSRDIADLSRAIAECLRTENRFRPGTVVDLGENDPGYVAARYRELLKEQI